MREQESVLVRVARLSLVQALEFLAVASPLTLRRSAWVRELMRVTAHFLPFEPFRFQRSAQLVTQLELFRAQKQAQLELAQTLLFATQRLGDFPLDQQWL
jgi:hypothetical protein